MEARPAGGVLKSFSSGHPRACSGARVSAPLLFQARFAVIPTAWF